MKFIMDLERILINQQTALDAINTQLFEIKEAANQAISQFYKERDKHNERMAKAKFYLQPRLKETDTGFSIFWVQYIPVKESKKVMTKHISKGRSQKFSYPERTLRTKAKNDTEFELVWEFEQKFKIFRKSAHYLIESRKNLNFHLQNLENPA